MLCDKHKLKGFNVFRHRNYLDIGGHARECHASRVTVVLSACSLRTCAFYSNNTETVIVESSLISLCFFTRFSIHKEFEVTCHERVLGTYANPGQDWVDTILNNSPTPSPLLGPTLSAVFGCGYVNTKKQSP